MAQRTPPAWFVMALKAINRHFTVEWSERRQRWAIMERVRWASFVGDVEGAPVYAIRRRPLAALFFFNLNQRTIEHIRKADPRRYGSVQEMIDKLDIDDKHGHQHSNLQAIG